MLTFGNYAKRPYIILIIILIDIINAVYLIIIVLPTGKYYWTSKVFHISCERIPFQHQLKLHTKRKSGPLDLLF